LAGLAQHQLSIITGKLCGALRHYLGALLMLTSILLMWYLPYPLIELCN
jgi:hypothetical protein